MHQKPFIKVCEDQFENRLSRSRSYKENYLHKLSALIGLNFLLSQSERWKFSLWDRAWSSLVEGDEYSSCKLLCLFKPKTNADLNLIWSWNIC